VEQIALLFTTGEMPGMVHDALSRNDVMQGGEFEDCGEGPGWPVLVHYYSSCEERFFSAVDRL
jgi:hypothetical protein